MRTRMFGKINQSGILRKGEQSFLCVTCLPDLIHISIKLHEDNSERLLSYEEYKNVDRRMDSAIIRPFFFKMGV